MKLERVPWFLGPKKFKIGMVWGARGVASPADYLASFDQLHSCTALLLSFVL